MLCIKVQLGRTVERNTYTKLVFCLQLLAQFFSNLLAFFLLLLNKVCFKLTNFSISSSVRGKSHFNKRRPARWHYVRESCQNIHSIISSTMSLNCSRMPSDIPEESLCSKGGTKTSGKIIWLSASICEVPFQVGSSSLLNLFTVQRMRILSLYFELAKRLLLYVDCSLNRWQSSLALPVP